MSSFPQPENLLLYRKQSLEIKIVDFGLAVQLQEGQEMKSLVGTAEYVCKSHFLVNLFTSCTFCIIYVPVVHIQLYFLVTFTFIFVIM